MLQMLIKTLPWRGSGLVRELHDALAELGLGYLLDRALRNVSQKGCEHPAGGHGEK